MYIFNQAQLHYISLTAKPPTQKQKIPSVCVQVSVQSLASLASSCFFFFFASALPNYSTLHKPLARSLFFFFFLPDLGLHAHTYIYINVYCIYILLGVV